MKSRTEWKTPRDLCLILISILTISMTATAQDLDEDSNWFKEIRGQDDYYSRFDFTRYTKADVKRAIQRYQAIVSDNKKNDWHGVYSRAGSESGQGEFHWSSSGYIYFHVYHTLAALDFGSVREHADIVQMLSETEATSKKRQIIQNTYVKVKYGNRRFLVPEKQLQAFLNRAVGRNTSIVELGTHLEKSGDENAKAFGLPIVPAKYGRMVRSPIVTEILRVGRRKIHQNKFDDGTINYEEVYRYVEIASGRNRGVAVGMNFYVDDLGEWIEVTSVRTKTSTGRIRRDYKQGEEDCWDTERGQGQPVVCKPPRGGMRARTKVSDLYF